MSARKTLGLSLLGALLMLALDWGIKRFLRWPEEGIADPPWLRKAVFWDGWPAPVKERTWTWISERNGLQVFTLVRRRLEISAEFPRDQLASRLAAAESLLLCTPPGVTPAQIQALRHLVQETRRARPDVPLFKCVWKGPPIRMPSPAMLVLHRDLGFLGSDGQPVPPHRWETAGERDTRQKSARP